MKPELRHCIPACLYLLVMMLPSQAHAQRFADVTPDYWAYNFIETLADAGVTAGCGNGNYCPEALVSRAQMAVFIERGINGSGFSPPAATGNVFTDIAAGDFAAAWIEQFFADGITVGCGNNKYCPDNSVTRAEMAVFLERGMRGSGFSPPPATGVFSDVGVGDFAAAWIEQLAADGITVGCGGGKFCPANQVTRAEMAVFLVRAFNLVQTPPATIALSPTDGSTSIDLGPVVSATFNEGIAGATVSNGSFSLSRGGVDVPAAVILDSVNNKAKLGTEKTLALLTEYTATLDSSITDLSGNAIPQSSWTFTSRDGAWLPAEEAADEFGSGMADSLSFAVSANGNAIAVWHQSDGTIDNVYANHYEPGRGWGVRELVETDTTYSSNNPQVAMDDAGNAMVVWERLDGGVSFARSIWANHYVAGSGWGVPEPLEAAAGNAFDQQIVLDAAGNGLAVWAQNDSGPLRSIWANRYAFGVGWNGPELLETGIGDALEPQAALNDAGIAFVVWSQPEDEFDSVTNIWANRFVPDGGWEGARLVESEAFEYATAPRIGVDQAGEATVVWLRETDIGGGEFLDQVWANRFVADNSVKTYQYTGANFNVVSGTRFSASDTVTGSFTIDCGLAGGSGDCSSLPFANYAAAVTECSFTASGSPELTITCADAEPGYIFNLTTDAGGLLSGSYNIAFESSLEGGNGARIVLNNTGGFTVARPGAAGGEGRVDYTAGAWNAQILASWGNEIRLTTDEFALADAPKITVKEDGNVFVVWQEDDCTIENPVTNDCIWDVWVSRYVPGAGWDVPERIESDDINDSVEPAIAVDDAGNAIAVWRTRTSSTAYTISASRDIPGSGWGASTQVGDITGTTRVRYPLPFFDPRIAADSFGNMVVVWAKEEPDANGSRIFFNRFGGASEPSGKLITETVFSDPLLAQCVVAAAAANSWHFAQEVTALDCSNKGIRSLGGLRTFVNLTTLDLSNNALDDVDVIERFTVLQSVNLSGNPDLTDLGALASAGQLTQVNLGGSGSGAIDCGILDVLTGNGMSVIAPGSCRQRIANAGLPDAALQSCAIKQAARKGVRFVDELTELNCERGVTILESELILTLDGVQVFENLEAININRSNVNDLTPLTGLQKLKRVNASSTFITNLNALTASPSLEVLSVQTTPRLYNDMTSAEDPAGISILTSMPSLREVYLNEKDYCSAQAQCVTGGGRMDCQALDALEGSFDVFMRPQSCNMPLNQVLTEITDPNLAQCVSETAAAANPALIDTDGFTFLSCTERGILELDGLERFGSIREIFLDLNPIQDLAPLDGVGTLQQLSVSDTNITDFDGLVSLELLRRVNARNNPSLTNVDELMRMQKLGAFNNQFPNDVLGVDLSNSGNGNIQCAVMDRVEAIVDANKAVSPAPLLVGFSPSPRTPADCAGGPPLPPFEGRSSDIAGIPGQSGSDLVLEFNAPAGALVTANWVTAVSAMNTFNIGAGLPGFDLQTYSRARAVAVGDANNNTYDDVLLQLDSAIDDSVVWQVWFADGAGGSGGASGTVSLPEGKLHNAQAIGFADVNGDGFADILLQEEHDVVDSGGFTIAVVRYYLSLGTGIGFATPQQILNDVPVRVAFIPGIGDQEGFRRPRIIALDDLNNDGSAELVMAFDYAASDPSSNRYTFCVRSYPFQQPLTEPLSTPINCHSESFGPRTLLDAATVADITGNNRKELVLTLKYGVEFDRGGEVGHAIAALRLTENAGNPTWSNYAVYSQFRFPGRLESRTVAVADVNNDRRSDVVFEVTNVSTREKFWWVYLASEDNDGDPTFELQIDSVPSVASLGNELRAIGMLDFDNDAGRLPDLLFLSRDLTTGDYGLYVATNAGGSFNSLTSWYQDAALPKIVGLEEDGLTYLANDTSELLQWVGVRSTYYSRKQFDDFLARRDFSLAQGPELTDPDRKLIQGGCQINYDPPEVETEVKEIYDVPYQGNVEVSYGLLVCNYKIGDRVSLKTQVVYGGCNAGGGLGTLGVSAKCEVGLYSSTLEADLTPPPPLNVETTATVTAKGPNASAGARFGFSPDGLMKGEPIGADFDASAELVSTSGSVEVAGVGAGAKLAIGVGVGGGMDIEDGVISGEIKLAFLVGGSLEFNVDVEEVGGNLVSSAKGFYKVGKTSYTFAGDAANEGGKFVVFTAGPAVYDAASQIGGAVEDEAEKAGKVVLTEAGEAVYFFAGPEGEQIFILFTDTAGRTIVAIFNALEGAATDFAEGAAGLIVDIGNGLADGAARLWNWF